MIYIHLYIHLYNRNYASQNTENISKSEEIIFPCCDYGWLQIILSLFLTFYEFLKVNWNGGCSLLEILELGKTQLIIFSEFILLLSAPTLLNCVLLPNNMHCLPAFFLLFLLLRSCFLHVFILPPLTYQDSSSWSSFFLICPPYSICPPSRWS